MDKRGAVLLCDARERAQGKRVDRKRVDGMALGFVNVIERGAVDDEIRLRLVHHARDGGDVGHIERRARLRGDVSILKRPQHRGGKLP